MSSDLRVTVCHSITNTEPIPLCLPNIDHQIFPDIKQLKNYVVTHSESFSFIVLLIDLNDRNLDADFEELKAQRHVFAIFIRVKPNCNLRFHGNNVFPVIKQRISREVESSVIQFFEDTSRKLLALNQIGLAFFFQDKANAIKKTKFYKYTASHVLIIPLNTTDENLYDFQERLITSCNELCGDYEPRVCTIYDYFPSNEIINIYESPYADFILHNDNQDNYNETYTLVENQPITEHIKQILPYIFNSSLPLINRRIKRLEEIQNDINFVAALERANVILQNREMIADVELRQGITNRSESPVDISAAFRVIEQAKNGPTPHNDGDSEGDIVKKIQDDY
ncbi:unnamed protein product [Rotaria sordida]|uniref:Uncharacterized protein n=1 Tax=Rotaria sordida TaxID=392033 RepID=A0A819RW19_9BILA|nr:unnamed protein product [Rotaria sordida]